MPRLSLQRVRYGAKEQSDGDRIAHYMGNIRVQSERGHRAPEFAVKYLLSIRTPALKPRHRRIRYDGNAKEHQNQYARNCTPHKRACRIYRLRSLREFRRVLTLVFEKSGTRPIYLFTRYAENEAVRALTQARG